MLPICINVLSHVLNRLKEPNKLLSDGKESNANYLIVDVPLGFIQRIEKMFNYNSNQINECMGILINCKVKYFNNYN